MALILFVTGIAVAALVVFRPTHRRLRSLQQAAAALGGGQRSVRAPESGGDEVASLARTFNDMARKLGDRTDALAEADRTQRQLLADVSHELNTPVAMLFARLRDRHLRALQEKNIRFETIGAPEAADLYGDATRLEQAVQNLVANAIRHTPDGGTVRVGGREGDTGISSVYSRYGEITRRSSGMSRRSNAGRGRAVARALPVRDGSHTCGRVLT